MMVYGTRRRAGKYEEKFDKLSNYDIRIEMKAKPFAKNILIIKIGDMERIT